MYKIIALLLLMVTLTGCYVLKTPYTAYGVSIDYSPYTNEGFFLTESNVVSFPYQALGSIEGRARSGYEEKINTKQGAKRLHDDVYGKEHKLSWSYVKPGDFREATPEDALRMALSEAKSMGANGLINLRIEYLPAIYETYKDLVPVFYAGYSVKGMAIKK